MATTGATHDSAEAVKYREVLSDIYFWKQRWIDNLFPSLFPSPVGSPFLFPVESPPPEKEMLQTFSLADRKPLQNPRHHYRVPLEPEVASDD